MLQSRLPVLSEPQLARRLEHPLLAPGELPIRDRDQLLRRVGDHLAGQVGRHPVRADRVADDGLLTPLRPSDHLRPQRGQVAVQGVVGLLEGLFRPPGEEGVVAGVVAVPGSECTSVGLKHPHGPEPRDRRRGRLPVPAPASPPGGGPVGEYALGLPDRNGQRRQLPRDRFPIDRLHEAPDRQQIEDVLREGQQRRHLGERARLPGEQFPPVAQFAGQQHMIDARVDVAPRDLEPVESGRPAHQKLPHPCLARGGIGHVPPLPLECSEVACETVHKQREARLFEGRDAGEVRDGGGGLRCGG